MSDRVGPSTANVLISGENGTGKRLVAQRLHSVSARAAQPLVTVNTGGLSEGVFESEHFGHVRGAFTDAKWDRVGRFELADGGALFLDEMSLADVERILIQKGLARHGGNVSDAAKVLGSSRRALYRRLDKYGL